ncbi:MAG: hypothetical protein R3318_02400 [Gammaproteobacteria bacterium]|nr:hypothetical protein [Gammaproteobacteria bacterium]
MSIIEDIYSLDEDRTQLLYRGENAEIRQFHQYRWLNLDGDLIQSIMDLEQPARLLNPVNIYMLTALAFTTNLSSVLNLGFGGGVFERFFRHYCPEIQLHSVESNETVIHLAREFFDIDPDYPVYLQPAEKFVSEVDAAYGLILCDIFSQEHHPDCLYHDAFYRDCQRCLDEDGLMVVNLVTDTEEKLLEVLLPLRKSFAYSCLLEIPHHNNILVFSCRHDFLKRFDAESGAELDSRYGLDISSQVSLLQPLPPR